MDYIIGFLCIGLSFGFIFWGCHIFMTIENCKKYGWADYKRFKRRLEKRLNNWGNN